jgi:4-hydroxy-tetrahydrodipicolinate synthase
MTGFAFPEVLIAVCRAWEGGDHDLAAETYYRYLPMLMFEGQPKVGVAIRKEVLRRRGLINCALVRQPGLKLDDGTRDGLLATLAFTGIEEAFPPPA